MADFAKLQLRAPLNGEPFQIRQCCPQLAVIALHNPGYFTFLITHKPDKQLFNMRKLLCMFHDPVQNRLAALIPRIAPVSDRQICQPREIWVSQNIFDHALHAFFSAFIIFIRIGIYFHGSLDMFKYTFLFLFCAQSSVVTETGNMLFSNFPLSFFYFSFLYTAFH